VNPLEILSRPSVTEAAGKLEGLLRDSVTTGEDFLDQITTHLIAAGGKRIRPVLALASASHSAREITQDDLLGGVSVELVHLASLYHDDVMDEAEIRRNVESVNSRYGNMVAIVAGDYLLARSAAIAASLGTEIASLLANTLASLTEGQVSEVRTAFSPERSRDDYFSAIGGKTSSLMATSARIGALTSERPRDEVELLTTYGYQLGNVFQLRDDILDMVATDGQLGKPAGQDLAEGIYTLPALIALEDATHGAQLRDLLGSALSDEEREQARQLVVATDGVHETFAVARSYVAICNEAAGGLEPELGAGLSALASGLLEDLPI